MSFFQGFPEGKTHLTPVPETFFADLLPGIDHLGELKISIYFFWRLDHLEGKFRYLRRSDFAHDQRFMDGMGETPEGAQTNLDNALSRAIARGTILEANLKTDQGEETLYFLNSPRGRAAIRAIEAGQWHPGDRPETPFEVEAEPPNIFRLYEENFGPLSPMIAEALGEAEDTYPASWIDDAMRIAVEKNKRNWRYVAAILERWQREGRDAREEKRKDRHDSEKSRRRYVEGEFSDFVEH